jgi:hypothetical protein
MQSSWRMTWRSLVATAVLVSVALTAGGCGGGSDSEAPPDVIALAKRAYEDAKERGVDMSRGPCLGVVSEGWVADVAHDPREPVDDEPANQCEQYRSGRVDHFVELDPDGKLIRSR